MRLVGELDLMEVDRCFQEHQVVPTLHCYFDKKILPKRLLKLIKQLIKEYKICKSVCSYIRMISEKQKETKYEFKEFRRKNS